MRVFPVLFAAASIASGCGRATFQGSGSSSNAPTPTTSPEGGANPTTPPENKVPPTVDPYVNDPAKKQLIFGDDKVFHIGDSKYPGSSCKEELDSYELSGTQYFFQFEVLEPDTIINVAINKVCGVDYNNSNFAYVVNDANKTLADNKVTRSQTQIPFEPMTLSPGKYSITVVSNRNRDRSIGVINDYDNFVIGKIVVSYSKDIRPIGVRTQ